MSDWYSEAVGGSAPPDAEKQDWHSLAVGQTEGIAPPIKVQNVSDRGAGIGTSAVASLANDTRAQIRYFAKQRGIPESRYGIKDGQIFYLGEDGNAYAEVPENWDPTSIARRFAGGVGPSMPAVGGAIGGIASAPLMAAGPAGLAGSMAISGGGAAAGQTLREGLANLLMDQEVSPGRIVYEGAASMLGQGTGAGLTSFGNRAVARDISRMDPAKANATMANANAQGIPLTAAEATNLPSLKAQQKYVSNTLGGQDIMGDFYEQRAGKVSEAINRYLGKLSSVDSAEVAGKMGQDASKTAIKTAVDARRAAASPIYQSAMKMTLADDVAENLAKDPIVADALGYVRNSKVYAREIGNLPNTSLQVMDLVKRRLDDMYEAAKRSGNGNEARLISGARDEFVTALDAATDVGGTSVYKAARDAFAGKSPQVDALRGGVVGTIAEMDPAKAAEAAQKLFGPKSGPMAIADARAALQKADPTAWQALKRTWVQDLFETASKENATAYQGSGPNVAGKFAALIENNKSRLKAALDPAEFAALSDLTDVLKAASRVKPIGSDTEYNRLITENMKDQARPVWARIAGNINPAQALRNFDDWLTNRSMEQISEKLATAITNPNSLQQLKQLKMLSPTSVNFRIVAGHLLAQGGQSGVDAMLFAPADVSPTSGP